MQYKKVGTCMNGKRNSGNRIKLYELTERAENQYRMNAKQSKNIDISILNRKISALIYASRDRYYYSMEDATVCFGSCIITFSLDKVIDICWSNKEHKGMISAVEKRALLDAYDYFGLNSRGTAYKENE